MKALTREDMKVGTGDSLLEVYPRRASVVPYVVRRGTVYVLYGVDAASQDITDLGGGVKKYENGLTAGLREFREESKGVFSDVYTSVWKSSWKSVGIHTDSMSVMYLRVDDTYYNTVVDAFSATKKDTKDELDRLIWLSEADFTDVVRGKHRKHHMWGRIKNFYKGCDIDELFDLLLAMEWVHL